MSNKSGISFISGCILDSRPSSPFRLIGIPQSCLRRSGSAKSETLRCVTTPTRWRQSFGIPGSRAVSSSRRIESSLSVEPILCLQGQETSHFDSIGSIRIRKRTKISFTSMHCTAVKKRSVFGCRSAVHWRCCFGAAISFMKAISKEPMSNGSRPRSRQAGSSMGSFASLSSDHRTFLSS